MASSDCGVGYSHEELLLEIRTSSILLLSHFCYGLMGRGFWLLLILTTADLEVAAARYHNLSIPLLLHTFELSATCMPSQSLCCGAQNLADGQACFVLS